jgi:uncharacterized protein (DUF952 family)
MTDDIFHITTRTCWIGAQHSGFYSAESLSKEGFIHCSRKTQLLRVANLHFANQSSLMILEIDLSILTPEVRWEPAADREDELFPHVYGAINLDSVVGVFDFECESDGIFHLPRELIAIEQ